MGLTEAIAAFVTLFVIIDPIGLTPVFATLTRGHDRARQAVIARTTIAVSALILLGFALFGKAFLTAIGISMAAFRISGGLLLFLIALDMLFERRSERRANQAEQAETEHGEAPQDPSVFPLAIPLIAGPGSIATVILLMGEAPDLAASATVLLILASVLGVSWVMFLYGSRLMMRLVGDRGIIVITRLLGMLLAALSVQFVIDGLAEAFASMIG